MLPRMVRSPVEICLGTRPSQAAKSRPLENPSPVPIAATMALEMIGPMPGTLISRTHAGSRRASSSISLDSSSMRRSSQRQSPARPSMARAMRGEKAWQFCSQEALALPYCDAALQQKGADLIDNASALADQSLTHTMQRLQVELVGGLCGHK